MVDFKWEEVEYVATGPFKMAPSYCPMFPKAREDLSLSK